MIIGEYVEKFRSLTGDIWDQTTLVMGYKCNFSKGFILIIKNIERK